MAFKLVLMAATFAAGIAGSANSLVNTPTHKAAAAVPGPERGFHIESACAWKAPDTASAGDWAFRLCIRNDGAGAPVRFLSARAILADGSEVELTPADPAAPTAVVADGWVNVDLVAAHADTSRIWSATPQSVVVEGSARGCPIACEGRLAVRGSTKP